MEFVCKLNTFVNKIIYIFEPISLFNIMQLYCQTSEGSAQDSTPFLYRWLT